MSTINSTSSINDSGKEQATASTTSSSVEDVVKSVVGMSTIDTDGSKTLNSKMSSRLLEDAIDPDTSYNWSDQTR